VISKILQILGLQPRISKVFLPVGQNNFGKKIPFTTSKMDFAPFRLRFRVLIVGPKLLLLDL
jgi:hypothetical protein